ncbi:MAG: type II secretion system F family protein [Oscillospiraceae bacterium]
MKKRQLPDDAVSSLCLELAEIIKSGITVSEGFLLLSEQESAPEVRSALKDVYGETDSGGEVSAALDKCGIFPKHMVKMLKVAERTGSTEQVLRELSTYYRRQFELKRTLRSTVTYPLLLLVIILAVFFVFLTEVLPVFDRVFSQIGAQMTPLAEGFLNFGLKLAEVKWVLLAVFAAAAVLIACCFFIPTLSTRASSWILKLFSRGKTGRSVNMARISSVMALSVSGTRDLEEALELSIEFAGGGSGEEQLERCAEAVRNGGSFASAAAETGLLSPAYCRMLAIGERTGSTESMMREMADRSRDEMERSISSLTGKVEPVAVIILSVCVGLLLLSVMLPLVGIMSAL